MSLRDYVLALGAIISGLAIADIVTSAHRLIRARDRVRWDLLPFLAAAWAAIAVTFGWFIAWDTSAGDFNPTYGRFWVFLSQLVCVYLMSAASLPDEVPEAGLDMRAFYDRNGRYFWLASGALILLFAVVTLTSSKLGVREKLVATGFNAVPLAISLALAVTRRRLAHYALGGALVAFALVITLPQRLS